MKKKNVLFFSVLLMFFIMPTWANKEKGVFNSASNMQIFGGEIKSAPREVLDAIQKNVEIYNAKFLANSKRLKSPLESKDSFTILAGYAYSHNSDALPRGNNCFGFDIKNLNSVRIFESPFDHENSWGIAPEGYTIRVYAGAWTGNEWQVLTVLYKSFTTYYGHRMAFDPATKQLRVLGQAPEITLSDMAYDFKANKLYGVGDRRLFSLNLNTPEISVIDTIKLQDGDLIKFNFMALACDSSGQLFTMTGGAFSSDRKMYKLNSNTAKATLVGALPSKYLLNTYLAPMTFDRNTNQLYWNEVGENMYLNIISTDSAKDLSVKPMYELGIQATGLFHHYYETNLPHAEDVTNMNAYTLASEPLKVNITWNNPSFNYHGQPLTNLSKIYIYRGLMNGKPQIVDSVLTTEAGKSMTYSRLETQAGTYFYGLRAGSSPNSYSPNVIGRNVYCFPLNLPYEIGFESMDNKIPLTYINEHFTSVSTSEKHSGSSSFRLDTSYARIQMNGIPVKKGGTYQVDVWAKNSKAVSGWTVLNSISCWIGKELFSVDITPSWAKYSFTTTSTSDDRVLVALQTSVLSGHYIYFDDISVKELYPNTVPNKPSDLTVIAADSGLLYAKLSFKTPAFNAGDENLASIKGVYVEASTSSSFTTVVRDTILTTAIGTTVNGNARVGAKGRWYFRIKAYNDQGPSPYYSSSVYSAYIGFDTVAKAPTMKEPLAYRNGDILLQWREVTSFGPNGGYFDGKVTGYRVVVSPGKTKTTDTIIVADTFALLQSYPMNYYTINVATLRNGSFPSTNTLSSTIMGANGHLNMVRNSVIATYVQEKMFNVSTSDNSGVSQTIYTKEDIGEMCLIDTLIFFVKSDNTTPTSKKFKIHLSFTNDSCYFSSSCLPKRSYLSFVGLGSSLVFDDTITFAPGEYTMKIPIKPFLYDNRQDLVVTVIKAKTTKASRVINFRAHATTVSGQTYLLTSTATNQDYDTIQDAKSILHAGTPYIMTAAMILSKKMNLAKISGTITSKRDGSIIEGASISIKSSGNANPILISHDFLGNENGMYEFNHLVSNTYIVKFSKAGYADTSIIIQAIEGNSYSFSISLDDATKLLVKGKVKNHLGENIPNAVVKMVGLNTYQVTTDNNGEFQLSNVFGSTSYQLSCNKEFYTPYSQQIFLLTTDTVLPPFVLDYVPYPSRFAQVKEIPSGVEVKWNKPALTSDAKILKWCADSVEYSGVGAAAKAFIAASQFTVEDVKALQIGERKLTKVVFNIRDNSAFCTLKIYKGENASEEIYSKYLGNNLLGWNTIALPQPIIVDTNQELWIGVNIGAGYAYSPMGVDAGPRTKIKGERVFFEGRWQLLTDLSTMNVNWAIKTIFEKVSELDPAEGYDVYRGLASDVKNVSNWEKVNSVSVKTLTYSDPSWLNANYGVYQYAVRANWKNQNLSTPVFSDTINKDMEFALQVKVISNGVNAVNAKLVLTSVDPGTSYTKSQLTTADGLLTFEKVWRGNYKIELTKSAHTTVRISKVMISKDTLIIMDTLREVKAQPIIKEAFVQERSVRLGWTMLETKSWKDDVESHTNFAINGISNYEMLDLQSKYGVSGVSWNNAGLRQAFIVFNATATTPALSVATWGAKSGVKCFASFSSTSGINSDFITRKVEGGGGVLKFWAKGIGYQGVQEKFQVMYSTSLNTISNYRVLIDSEVQTATANWKEYTFNIPSEAKFVAIKNISNGTFCLLVDDLEFNHSSDFGTPQPISYHLFVDGEKVDEINAPATQYQFSNLELGSRELGIAAVYRSGLSEISKEVVEILGVGNHFLEENNVDIKVYPNPSAQGIYNLRSSEIAQGIVYTQKGEIVKQISIVEGEQIIDMSKVAKGIYFLEVKSLKAVKVIKLVK